VAEKNILSVKNLSVEYKVGRGIVKAVTEVDLDIYKGESVALIGESGCGKTTMGLAMMNLVPPPGYIKEGEILFYGGTEPFNILSLDKGDLRNFRWKEISMVFQSALNALNPVMRVWDHIYDTARAHGKGSPEETKKRALELLELVRLEPERVLKAYPHELSGGMKQRALIAISLLLNPKIIILDEPTTALDILTQKNILKVLEDIKNKLNLSMIFISHDLSLAAELSDRIAVMYAGKIVELAEVYDLFYDSKHPYTVGLIRSVPTVTAEFKELIPIPGSPPDLISLPSGCPFHPRCEYATEGCEEEVPELIKVSEDHYVSCFRWREMKS